MNILVFEQRYTSPSEPGIGRFGLFARDWAKENNKITIISGMVNYISGLQPEKYRGKIFAKERESENITVIRVFDSLPGYRTFLGRLLSYFVFMKLAFWAGIFGKKADVVIASSPPIFVGFIGYIVSVFKRASFVFEVRDLWPDVTVELGFLKNKILIKMSRILEKFIYRRAVKIIVNSPGLKNFLITEKKLDERKIEVIINPVNIKPDTIHEPELLRERFGWKNKFVVIYTGAMSAVYDLNSFLDVAKGFSDHPEFLFVLMGDGRQRTDLENRIRKENIGNVSFLPPVSKKEVSNFILASDVCAVPLGSMRFLKYVYATKIFDYMSGGKPIVLMMDGVSADLVCKEAQCGICVVPGDKEGFKNAILELFNNEEMREKLGENGYYFAKINFSAKKLSKEYLDIIKKVASSK